MLNLATEKREIFGKKLTNSRKEEKLPAVLYGRKHKSTNVFINLREFKKVLKNAGESTIIELNDGSSQVNVLIHDVSYNTITNEPVHVDFYVVEMDKAIITDVPLVFIGVAPAVKELSGILVKVIHEVEVESLPKDLPHEITVDVSSLKTFEDQITIGDLVLPNGVKIHGKPEEVVVLVEEHKEEVVEERTIDDIKVEEKGKKEEPTDAEKAA